MLTLDQQQLLIALVDAVRSTSREQRHPFLIRRSFLSNESILRHAGLSGGSMQVYEGDVDELRRAGLVAASGRYSQFNGFDVTAEGFAVADELATKSGEAMSRVEDAIRRHLLSPDGFRRRFPAAFERWAQAESMLWTASTESEFTTIGHLCREAMMEFTNVLVARHPQADAPGNPAATVARIRAVAATLRVSDSIRKHVDSMIVYWGTVSDLVQRQEHGALKEGERLTWEDGRRVVFQTCNIFYELDRLL